MSCPRELCSNKKGSLYLYLKSYKPTVFTQSRDNTPKSQSKQHYCNVNHNRNNRRKSCYCTECGTFSKFQFKTQDIPSVKSYYKPLRRKQIVISKTQSTSNMEEFSPQCEDSPLIKQSQLLSSRKSIRYAIHCRFRKSILLTNSEDKLQTISQQQLKKSSFFNNEQVFQNRTPSKGGSPQRKISQLAFGTLKQNYSLKSLSQRSPLHMESIPPKNSKYPNVYLMPINTNSKRQPNLYQKNINVSLKRERHCISQM